MKAFFRGIVIKRAAGLWPGSSSKITGTNLSQNISSFKTKTAQVGTKRDLTIAENNPLLVR